MKTILLLALALVIFTGWVRLMENRLTFYPTRDLVADPATVGIDFRDITFTASDGIELHGWYCLPPPGLPHRADLLFLHGNGGNVSHRLGKLRALTDMGLGIFIFDYRGYGRSGGRPSDAGVLRDAEAALAELQHLTEKTRRPRGLFGESIGCLPAVRLAASGPDFLILEGSFPGKREVAAATGLFRLFAPLLSDALAMGDAPSRVSCPVLVMHAGQDEVIPVALGREVHRRFEAGAVFHELRSGGHNDAFVVDPDFFPVIGGFLERVLGFPEVGSRG